MNSAEHEPRIVTYDLPKLIFDESVLDDELPYRVSANMEELGAFLFQHGMKPEHIGKLSVQVQRSLITFNSFYGILEEKYGEYNHRSRTLHLATDWSWYEYRKSIGEMEDVSQGEQIMLQEALTRRFNEVILHEAKHAIDSQDDKLPTRSQRIKSRIKYTGITAASIIGNTAVTMGSFAALVKMDSPTGVLLTPFIVDMAAVSAFLGFKMIRKSEGQKMHQQVFAFQRDHKDHMRWRSISALKPTKD